MDQKLLFLINSQWTTPAMDSFMATLSCFAAWVPLLALIVALAWFRGGFKARAMLVLLGLLIAVSDAAVSDTIKRAVNRPRPREALAGVRVVDLQPSLFQLLSIFKPPVIRLSPPPPENPRGHSFPSGHAINNFCAATLLTLFYRRRGWLYFIPAALISYSRVYVGAHWPGDVLVSAFMGDRPDTASLPVHRMGMARVRRPFAPALHARHPSLVEEAAV